MQQSMKRPLKVFLCHASNDKLHVKELFKRLADDSIDAWLDSEKLLPGQDWDYEIQKAVRQSDVIIVFLSKNSITKEGYVQKEIKLALDISDEKPEGTIFLIPARLENCEVPSRLSRWHWVDLFEVNGYQMLLKSLISRANDVGAHIGIHSDSQEPKNHFSQSISENNTQSIRRWEIDLIDEQKRAASYFGSHARLLAGPGTGKTLVLTRRIMYLIEEKGVNPDRILALTFTRAAAAELRQRVSDALGVENIPRISTLHSFALRQLLRNSKKMISLPQPLRIADDWEEKAIIVEDIKRVEEIRTVRRTEELFSQLSADWESLVPEEEFTPPAYFIAAWTNHRRIFGYTLRSELVYQLKRSLERIPDFELEHPLLHLLVDEYQDLNKCDLAVIKGIVDKSTMELFVAGDDDQSIYYFRKAHPEGIRRFPDEFVDVQDLPLIVCKRCDSSILEIAEFVAGLDVKRKSKGTRAESGRQRGDVKLLNFQNQQTEAQGIARICKHLIDNENISPNDILILLRTDRHGFFSKEIEEAFNSQVPISVYKKQEHIFDTNYGRHFYALFRLTKNIEDSLAWRSLLIIRKNMLGEKAFSEMVNLATDKSLTFYEVISAIHNGEFTIRFESKIKAEYELLTNMVNAIANSIQPTIDLNHQIDLVLDITTNDIDEKEKLRQYLIDVNNNGEFTSLDDLILNVESSHITETNFEQELSSDKVNILTMHRAKGLTSDVVFIVGAEDELIPGNNIQEPELGDERRLLFVSLTRAKHKLFITYCSNRTGTQQRSGRTPKSSRHHLTQFLSDSPLRPINGENYTAQLDI